MNSTQTEPMNSEQEPQVIGRLETESRWTRPMRSWQEARDLARKQLIHQAADVGAKLLFFDRAEVEESEDYITFRMFAFAFIGDCEALEKHIAKSAPGATASIS